MKKLLLFLIGILCFITTYCQDQRVVKDSFAEKLQAITGLVWPLIVLTVIYLLYPHVKKMLSKGDVSIKVGNMELNIQQAGTQLAKNVIDLEKSMMNLKCELDEIRNKEITVSPAAGKDHWRILWVTENHKSHAFEIAYLERDGVEVLKATSTKEAMKILKEESSSIDAIITGMNRKENETDNPTAGLELVRKVKSSGYPIEVYVMCSPNNVMQYYKQLKDAGAKEATSSPLELLSFLKGAGLNCPLQQKELVRMNTESGEK